jgi:hypothetical protein
MKIFRRHTAIPAMVAALALMLAFVPVKAMGSGEEEKPEKISPTMRLSYRIVDGKKTVKVNLSHKVGKKFEPITNLIVNLYNGEVKKYDPANATGWMTNQVTNDEGDCEFRLSEQFNRITAGTYTFTFIASISDPAYEDTQEEITMTAVKIDLNSMKDDSLTTVSARLSTVQDSGDAAMPEAELKLLVKRTFGAIPFSEDGATTDENGIISGVIPADLPGNDGKSITVVARFEDQENDGIIEVTKTLPWGVAPHANALDGRHLWSSGTNAPWSLVIASVSIIALIWGTIFYLVTFLFKIKRIGKQAV